jgi:pimeloyl-ACP methyl ester carboxylesterase
MRRTLIGIGVVALVVVLVGVGYPALRLLGLYLGSHVVDTSRGRMEIARQGQGPPVLLVHGLLGGYDQGLLLSDALVQNGFEVISVSRPGYLRTPIATGRTPEEQGEALAALLDNLGIPKVVVVGLSAGGMSSIQLSLHHPDRVAGLVLFSAVTEPWAANSSLSPPIRQRQLPIHPYRWDLYSLLGSLTARVDPKQAAARTLSLADLPDRAKQKALVAEIAASPEQRAFLDRLVDTTFPISGKVDGIRNDLTQITHLSEVPLERIAVPTLIIHGDADRILPYAGAVEAQRRIVGSQLLTVAGAGHLVQLGPNGPEIDAALVAFCQKVSGK